MRVTQIKRRRIDQRASSFFRRDFKAPQSRFSESVSDRAPLISVVTVGAERVVRCYQKDAGTGALEAHDVALTKLAPIKTEVIRSNAGGQ